ncbi:MAG: CPBP family intramembrane glutamic endopeptidase [Candidatus Muiribacteriaceae bacterium]
MTENKVFKIYLILFSVCVLRFIAFSNGHSVSDIFFDAEMNLMFSCTCTIGTFLFIKTLFAFSGLVFSGYLVYRCKNSVILLIIAIILFFIFWDIFNISLLQDIIYFPSSVSIRIADISALNMDIQNMRIEIYRADSGAIIFESNPLLFNIISAFTRIGLIVFCYPVVRKSKIIEYDRDPGLFLLLLPAVLITAILFSTGEGFLVAGIFSPAFLLYIIFSSFYEEIIFRVLLLTQFEKKIPFIHALIMHAMIFTIVHFNFLSVIHDIRLLITGVILGICYRKYGLYGSFLLHTIYNLAVISVLFLQYG